MSRADAGVFPNAQRSHSGLVHRSRKPEWLNGHRGFESHPLRHHEKSCKSCRKLCLKTVVDKIYKIFQDGEVQEWLNWQHWKCCERETVPWVRIPPSPPHEFLKFIQFPA